VLHVGLNLIFLVPGHTGGMEVAARETIARLATRDDLRLTLFVNQEAAREDLHGLPTVVVPVRATDRVQWVRGEQLLLPGLADRAGVDVLHSMGGTAPLRGRARRLTTIHDLNYRRVPEAHLGIRGRGMALLVPAAARRSHRLITDAAATVADLRDLLKVDPAKVDVVPLAAAPPRPELATPAGELRARLDLGARRVVLSVSAKRPHKNLLRLVQAVAGLPDVALVVPGYRTPHADELEAEAERLGIVLRMPDWVPDADLEGLYALAGVLAFPSLYEGFGLPVLEAMARGVPVVTSARGSLAEVAGDAALIVDPESVPAIADALGAVLDRPDLAQDLRARGLERARAFSWERTAELTVAAYRRTAA
jgi:glycosyltransferase involved in cell wall biosynthesis